MATSDQKTGLVIQSASIQSTTSGQTQIAPGARLLPEIPRFAQLIALLYPRQAPFGSYTTPAVE